MRRSQLLANQHSSRRRPPRSGRRPTSASPTPSSTRPIDGIVDVRAGAASAKSSTPGQPVVTLINPDDLWVRADVEETYIDRVRIGDKLHGPAAVGRRARGHGVLSRRRRGVRDAARRQPHQARHQDVRDPAARATTRIAGWRSGMTAYVLLPVDSRAGSIDMHCHRRPEHRQEVRRLHRRQRHQLRRRGRRDLRAARPERRRQVHADPDADDAAAADRRARRSINGFDVVEAGRRRPAVDWRHSAGDDQRPRAERRGEPADFREAVRRAARQAAAADRGAARGGRAHAVGATSRSRTSRAACAAASRSRAAWSTSRASSSSTSRRPASIRSRASRVWEMLQKIKQQRDLTVLITTHYMDEADKLCDRIAIVDHGELKALDSPLKLKASIPGQERARGELLRDPPPDWLERLASAAGRRERDRRRATCSGSRRATARRRRSR